MLNVVSIFFSQADETVPFMAHIIPNRLSAQPSTAYRTFDSKSSSARKAAEYIFLPIASIFVSYFFLSGLHGYLR
jgi:hypothetical protein